MWVELVLDKLCQPRNKLKFGSSEFGRVYQLLPPDGPQAFISN